MTARDDFDDRQRQAVLVTRPCCGRTVYATHPDRPCPVCTDRYRP